MTLQIWHFFLVFFFCAEMSMKSENWQMCEWKHRYEYKRWACWRMLTHVVACWACCSSSIRFVTLIGRGAMTSGGIPCAFLCYVVMISLGMSVPTQQSPSIIFVKHGTKKIFRWKMHSLFKRSAGWWNISNTAPWYTKWCLQLFWLFTLPGEMIQFEYFWDGQWVETTI